MQKENYHFRDATDNYITNGKTDHMGVELSLIGADARLVNRFATDLCTA